MFMRLLLAVPILALPNMLHLTVDTRIPGVNLSNLLFLIVLAGLAVSHPPKEFAPTKHGMLTPALLSLFGVLVIGTVIAIWSMPLKFMDDFTYIKNAIFYPLFYFVYRRCGQNLQGTRQLIIFTMIVAAVAGVEAIREGLQYGIGHYSDAHRASGPFGVDYHDANRAGVFFAMFLPMFVAMAAFFRRQKFWRMAALAGCVIMALAIMATYSRQAYLIALVGVVLLLLRRSIVVAVLVGTILVASVNYLPGSVTQRVQETAQRTASGEEEVDVSTASRFDIWAGAMRMWIEHPMGVGLNRFKKHIGDYSHYRGYDAHNFYVLMLAECGPLGLAVMVWLLWRLWKLARLLQRSAATAEDPEARALALGFTWVVISMALGNLYGSPFFEGAIMTNFWVLCGLLEHYATLKNRNAGSANILDPGIPFVKPSIGERFPLAGRAQPGRYRQ